MFPWKRAKCSATWERRANTWALGGNKVIILALSSQTSIAVMPWAGGNHHGAVLAAVVPSGRIGIVAEKAI